MFECLCEVVARVGVLAEGEGADAVGEVVVEGGWSAIRSFV